MQDDQKQPEISLQDLDNAPSSRKASDKDVRVTTEDYAKVFSRVSEENESLKDEVSELNRRLKTSEALDKLIEPSATKAFRYMFVYSACVGIIILLNGFGCFTNPLDSEVLRFLVGSTAVTVIGLVGMVLTGVFVGARK